MASDSAKRKKPEVPCPACGTPTVFSPDNLYRPFCSDRCKTIDLGAWASDQYRVAGGSDDKAPEQPSGDLN
ncbi:MAG: DNA gyrase inhibitor YacG [Burkholderiaceae bacterium]